MKKLILIIASVALFAACSKKQEAKPAGLTPQNATAKDITGNWLVTIDSAFTTTNGQTTVNVEPNIYGTFFDFNADGTAITGTTTTNVTCTYTLVAGALTLQDTTTAENLPFTIVMISANKLILRITESNGYGDLSCVKN